uniref:Myocardial zonula adherens protein n=1 Tax=Takifugu rubripes TaxID=31033 RepID=A0A674NM86_TAKRU
MRRYGAGPTVSRTTTEDPQEFLNERRIRRLRLTLHAGENENKEAKTANSEEAKKENNVKETWQKKNGLIQRERPAGRESPQQSHADMTNGVPEAPLQHPESKVSGAVQKTGPERQREVMARQWTVGHLQDEMRYIREVRDSLEKVRERMYGQFGGMQQSMQKLSREIRVKNSAAPCDCLRKRVKLEINVKMHATAWVLQEANTHRRSLESEVKTRTSAMDAYDQMNGSLIADNISLQKSLLDSCQSRMDKREELKSLKNTCEKAQQSLQEKEKELAAARAENQNLRLQVESSQEAQTQALQELSAKLQQDYDEKLQEEQKKHREEIEKLQAQLDDYILRLEEAEGKIRAAEAKIAEKDQRIVEVERLLGCMGKEKTELQAKLQECEQRLRLLELTDTTDASVARRSKDLQTETTGLRERIKHLNDMVFCQQRKVKAMIEEVESLRAQVAQKDMFISELLDRIAIVECENNELEDKLKYFMSIQNRPEGALETREVGLGCDLLPRSSESEPPTSSVRFGSDEVDAQTNTDKPSAPEESAPGLNLLQPRSRTPQVYSPFLKLMEFTANIKID